MTQQEHNDDRGGDAGGQCTNPRSGGPHVKAIDQNGVDRDIDEIDNQGAEHGYFAVAHGPEQSGAGVINAHKRIGRSGEEKIDQSAGHHIGLHTPEDQREDVLPEEQCRAHQQQGGGAHGIQQLLGGGTGIFPILPAQILRHHHRAAGRQGGKDLDDQRIDVIHQRDAGYGGLACGGDHDGIGHADGHQQKLLDDQRQNEPEQRVTGKEWFDLCAGFI